ncbi:histidine kinase dimerization/phosphoacceptor domain -containing protein [Flagellimonas sp. GZD32]|uniref:histidine kinase dimerization/phosphoacceptor domain -containing protein n=1 Tax=Flagellimonas cixiensis TaxID=3228750 RepID=UPI0035C8D0F7
MKTLSQLRTLILGVSFQFLFVYSYAQSTKKADSLGEILQQKQLTQSERSRLLSLRAYHHQVVDTSLALARQALKIAQEIDSPLLQAAAWEEISHIERRLGNNSVSLEASLKSLGIYESLGLKERAAASYSQLASNFISDGEYNVAIDYLKKAKRIYSESDSSGNQILTILNLGEAYRLAGYLDSAATCFQETLERNRTIKNDIVQGYSLGNLGMVYATQNKLEPARDNLKEAIAILKPLGDDYSTSVYLAELGGIYRKEGHGNLAEEKLLEAYQMALSAGLKEQIRDFSRLLSDLYEGQENFDKALWYQRLYQVYQDSLVNRENIRKIEQIKAGYEIDKRETEIQLLNLTNSNQKRTVLIMAIGLILLLSLAYLLFKVNKKINKANVELSFQKEIISEREQEKALLLKELNHRVKNNLQMISSLLNLQGRELKDHPAQEAILMGRNRVEALSLVHRKLYQEGLETRIMLKEYVEELVLGLCHGYDAPLQPDMEIVDTSVSVDIAVPIALIINETIVNALKYAYVDIENPKLSVVVRRVDQWLEIEIRDNGIGFTELEVAKNNSFGLKLMTSLIHQLEGSIEKRIGSGTHWSMKMRVA